MVESLPKPLNICGSHFQDSKEFQGELFGISNLFSDLSDKLFTSEIIEMHEDKKTKGLSPNTDQNTFQDGTSVLSEKIDAVGSVVSESQKATHPGKTATLMLEDFGNTSLLAPFPLISSSEHVLIVLFSFSFFHSFEDKPSHHMTRQ